MRLEKDPQASLYFLLPKVDHVMDSLQIILNFLSFVAISILICHGETQGANLPSSLTVTVGRLCG